MRVTNKPSNNAEMLELVEGGEQIDNREQADSPELILAMIQVESR